ncbi:D-hexose-6-phosphate mutarotase [Aliivibrio fischeri]|uniref:D-hexose-6-phosphate mutarotase n=1 Tax=Aliivibrio fischeri TaxID=668 RepID=UPI00080E4D1B|nr:D-hexose-6-phosphate mutarotase [Aliivibrio fischeri]MCE4934050.1 D-hexose-6-phosphate mutarotase [Aliivibrio fischeri]MUH95378.1 D-hexose-6-phosphate mutarotase [Aliivibrio fischeri]MUI64242.1 D-hexose-6-phosphate mutarotase [Aliivibrio fischeri]OCH03370.1 D-hexose-6-phosphate mutarotase [Aliivibrio fischeri]OCH24802.1 D-hexose-6-phosphate mutarotase [Aliivibrio fischeri]
MNLTQLPIISVLSDNVTVAQLDDVKVIRVIHDKANAAISLHGGHVLSFTPKGQDDLIWMSKEAIFNPEKAIRGGVPVCWPWFGRIADPAHGFARNNEWTLIEHRENDNGVIVVLGLEASEATKAIWPFEFEARLTVEIGDELHITLDAKNTDNKAWNCSGALHTYLNVADIASTTITGMGPTYIDGLQNAKLCTGEDTLSINAAVDRVYTQPENTVSVSDSQRTLTVTNSGHNAAVIWNPWIEGAESMADMNNDGYKTMVCVESTYHATSLEEAQTVEPGSAFTLTTTIKA